MMRSRMLRSEQRETIGSAFSSCSSRWVPAHCGNWRSVGEIRISVDRLISANPWRDSCACFQSQISTKVQLALPEMPRIARFEKQALVLQLPEIPTADDVATIAAERDDMEVSMEREWVEKFSLNFAQFTHRSVNIKPRCLRKSARSCRSPSTKRLRKHAGKFGRPDRFL